MEACRVVAEEHMPPSTVPATAARGHAGLLCAEGLTDDDCSIPSAAQAPGSSNSSCSDRAPPHLPDIYRQCLILFKTL